MASSRTYDLTFFTATILEWRHLLTNDGYKDIMIDSLRFLVKDERIQLNAFVIMNNHFHLIWHIYRPHNPESVQRDFLKFTAQMILKDLRNNNRELLADFYVGAKDRKHQVWERNPLSVGIHSEAVLKQKLRYIHNNPVKEGYCLRVEDYKYSTAALYNGMQSDWDFVTPCYF